jgi:hypothetical protein
MSFVLDGTEVHRTKRGHSMRHQQTEGPKDQRMLHLCATRQLFSPDKEEDATPEATFFVFLFHPFHFHLFTTNVT